MTVTWVTVASFSSVLTSSKFLSEVVKFLFSSTFIDFKIEMQLRTTKFHIFPLKISSTVSFLSIIFLKYI